MITITPMDAARKSWVVHSLVATHFLPAAQPNQKFVIHLNHNIVDNYFSNLAWASQLEKSLHTKAHRKAQIQSGERKKEEKKTIQTGDETANQTLNPKDCTFFFFVVSSGCSSSACECLVFLLFCFTEARLFADTGASSSRCPCSALCPAPAPLRSNTWHVLPRVPSLTLPPPPPSSPRRRLCPRL